MVDERAVTAIAALKQQKYITDSLVDEIAVTAISALQQQKNITDSLVDERAVTAISAWPSFNRPYASLLRNE